MTISKAAVFTAEKIIKPSSVVYMTKMKEMKTLNSKVAAASMKLTTVEAVTDAGIHLSALVPEDVPSGDGALEPLAVTQEREGLYAESSTVRDASMRPTTEEVPSDAGDPPSALAPEDAPDGVGATEPPTAPRRRLFVALCTVNLPSA